MNIPVNFIAIGYATKAFGAMPKIFYDFIDGSMIEKDLAISGLLSDIIIINSEYFGTR